MPELRELMDRVKGVEREYDAVSRAVTREQTAIRQGSLNKSPYLDAAADQLEPTYLIRVWAEFETTLRSYRRLITGNDDDRIRTKDLIDWAAGIKQGRAISEEARDDVHEVREYRNFLIHQRDDQAPPAAVAIREARGRLNIYLQKLPERW